MLIIEGMCERYSIETTYDAAYIGRPALNMRPSRQWRLRGLVRLNNFGRQADFVPWDGVRVAFAGKGDLCRKNGKPQWFMADIDHGTPRLMMEGVRRVYLDD